MFDVNLMDYFYDMEKYSGPDVDMEDKIDEAWYLYCYKLLGTANEKWMHLMDKKRVFQQPPLYDYIQVSDEALTQWTVKNRVEKLLLSNDEDNNTGKQKQGKSGQIKGVKTGEHESRAKLSLYMRLYKKINNACIDDQTMVKWNKKFWNKMKQHHSDLVLCDGSPLGNNKNKNGHMEFDLPGLDLPRKRKIREEDC